MLDYKKISNMFLIYRKKFKQFNDEINNSLVKYDITAQHAVYIMALDANGDMTVKDLNNCVDNDGAITTRVIKTLNNKGYVQKIGDTVKKYKIRLTKLGKSVARSVINAINRSRKLYLKEITQTEFLSLCKIAEKLS